MDPWLGYTEGLPGVLQKSYYYYNAKSFEDSIKKGYFNVGLLGVPQMIYYLRSDDWYTRVPGQIQARHDRLTIDSTNAVC